MEYKLWQYLNLWSIAAVLYGSKMDGKNRDGIVESDSNIKTARSFLETHLLPRSSLERYSNQNCSEIMKWNKKPKYSTDIRKEMLNECSKKKNGLPDIVDKNKAILEDYEYDSVEFRNRFLAFLSEIPDEGSISYDPKDNPRLNEVEKFDNDISNELVKTLRQRCRSFWKGSDDTSYDDAVTLTWLLLLALLGEKVSGIYGIKDFRRNNKAQQIYLNPTAELYRSRFCEKDMFLNNRADNKLKLQEVYQKPVFSVDSHTSDPDKYVRDIKGFLNERLQAVSSTSIQESSSVLTVLGKPGTGKTSLAQFIVSDSEMRNMLSANGFERIHVERFAELNIPKNIWNLEGEQMVSALLEACGITVKNVEELFVELKGIFLVLDGFDEIELEAGRKREDILKEIYGFFNVSHCKERNDFFLMITCRDEYVPEIGKGYSRYYDQFSSTKINYIVIQPMDCGQIINFCRQYNEVMRRYDQPEYDTTTLEKDELYKKSGDGNTSISEILGIPMILYMVVALNIIVDNENGSISVAKVYDQIFKAEGGIFDPSDYRSNTAVQKKRRDDKKQTRINTKLLWLSKLIALQMFQYSPDRTDCPEEVLRRMVSAVYSQDVSLKDIITAEELLKRVKGDNYIRSSVRIESMGTEEEGENNDGQIETDTVSAGLPYTEGSKNITFVHRSIYEYFTALLIFDEMKILSGDMTLSEKDVRKQEDVRVEKQRAAEKAGVILRLILQTRQPSPDIWKYLGQKMDAYGEEDPRKLIHMATCMEEWFRNCLKKEHKFLFSDKEWIGSNLELSEECLVIDPSIHNTVICMRHELICFLNSLTIVKELKQRAKKISAKKDDSPVLYTADENSNFYSYVRQAAFEFSDRKNIRENDRKTESALEAQITTLDLSRISMPGICLARSDFDGVNLDFSVLSGADISYSSFAGASIIGTDFSKSNMIHCIIRRAHTTEKEGDSSGIKIDFHEADIRNSDLQSCVLENADFRDCHLEDANMYRTVLTNADFTGAYLNGTDLCYSDLTGAIFHNAYLIQVSLEDADLSSAQFCDPKRNNGADLTGSGFSGAIIDIYTLFDTEGKAAVRLGDGKLPENRY